MSKPNSGNAKPVAEAKSAGKTNAIKGSVIKCEVNLNNGNWKSPAPCATYYIDNNATFPEIAFEIETDAPPPYQWSWEISWTVKACRQQQNKNRFPPRKPKTYKASGVCQTSATKWIANLDKQILGGILTVKVKAGANNFTRKTIICGQQPDKAAIEAELQKYMVLHAKNVALAKLIFKQESNFRHFYSDEQPLVSFDNGYGLGQATTPMPSYEQVWNWKKHVEYIATKVLVEKRQMAKDYLDKHKNYTDEDWDTETLVYYNGANFHYLVWDGKKWVKNENVRCDPQQSNKGWDLSQPENKNKTIDELRAGKGTAPKYTGRCYAEHIKQNNQGDH